MKLFLLFITVFSVGCTTTVEFRRVASELPGEGLHVVQFDDKECVIAENEDEALAMQCFKNPEPLRHEVIIKREDQ
jgi:hypothetical protein